jgi:hypothetical protein
MAKTTTTRSAKKSAKKKVGTPRRAAARRPVKRQGPSAAQKALEKLIRPLSDEQIEDLVTLGSIITQRKGPCMRIPKPTRLAANKWEVTTEDLTTDDVAAERAGPCMRIPRVKRGRD